MNGWYIKTGQIAIDFKEIILNYPELNSLSDQPSIAWEVWKDVKGYEGLYQVSNFGRIKVLDRKVKSKLNSGGFVTKKSRIFKIHCDSRGYPSVQLSLGTTKTFRVHRLVALHFLPEPSPELIDACKRHGKVYVNHKDGNKLNANVNNLEWCNQTYNCYHAVTEEVRDKLSGEKSPHAKLDAETVLKIVKTYQEGSHSQQELADVYGVKQITVSNILTGYSWSTVTGILKKERKFKKRQQPKVEGCH